MNRAKSTPPPVGADLYARRVLSAIVAVAFANNYACSRTRSAPTGGLHKACSVDYGEMKMVHSQNGLYDDLHGPVVSL